LWKAIGLLVCCGQAGYSVLAAKTGALWVWVFIFLCFSANFWLHFSPLVVKFKYKIHIKLKGLMPTLTRALHYQQSIAKQGASDPQRIADCVSDLTIWRNALLMGNAPDGLRNVTMEVQFNGRNYLIKVDSEGNADVQRKPDPI
jgi:hypothetical protein